jgi:Ring finger domain
LNKKPDIILSQSKPLFTLIKSIKTRDIHAKVFAHNFHQAFKHASSNIMIHLLRRNQRTSGEQSAQTEESRAEGSSAVPVTSSSSSSSSSSSRRHGHNERRHRPVENENSAGVTNINIQNHDQTSVTTAHLLHMRLRGLGDTDNMLPENAKLHDDCVICSEAFAVNDVVCRLPCGHIHHSSCILQWLRRDHDTCPTCRQCVVVRESAEEQASATVNYFDEDDTMDERHNKPMLQKHQNFDLIMRRVLRAQEEWRCGQCAEGIGNNKHGCAAATGEYEFDMFAVQQQQQQLSSASSSNHTRRTSFSSCSADWLVDDLEDFLKMYG